jgi:tRNA-dihydrouridine synthase
MFVVAPMVGQCDLPFRHLCRRHGATVVFSEMLVATRFAAEPGYRRQAFGRGVRADDHPLVCQFAANDPAAFVAAALEAQKLGVDAVDLNLGCPQRRGKEGWLAR